ncbi:MAG: DUF934 domain-containing protein [Deltaproteobacteria bacterium]|nr:MAG: DUF934 domain-containing protein [Deltaproteobacteria bacterium]
MRIIRDLEIVEDNRTRVPDDQPLPDGPVLVSLDRWRQDRDTLRERGDVGVYLSPEEDTHDLLDDLQDLPAIAFELPKFADGRPYSRARLLRERHEYDGELRAFGDVLRDQLLYLHRCGFNAFEVRADKDLDDALRGLRDFTVALQPASAPPPFGADV